MDGESTLISEDLPNGLIAFSARPTDTDGNRSEFAVRLQEGEPGLEGYVVPYNVLSDRKLFFLPGSFKRTAKVQFPYTHHLLEHWPSLIIGKHLYADAEDPKGFRVGVQINEDTPIGREVMSNYRFGINYAWSVGIDVVKKRTGRPADDANLDRRMAPREHRDLPIEELEAVEEAFWWETSTVPWGGLMSAGPDVIQGRGAILDASIDYEALMFALRRGRLSLEQRRQLEAVLAAAQARPAPGPTDHGTREELGEPTVPLRRDWEVAMVEMQRLGLSLSELAA